jgi:hypothetical protein
MYEALVKIKGESKSIEQATKDIKMRLVLTAGFPEKYIEVVEVKKLP